MSPPLREDPSTPAFLMDLLGNGDLELASSAHAPFNVSARALGKDDFTRIPHGTTGIEERLSVVWDRGVRAGKLDPCRFVAVTSTNAAKLFNMYPRKGRIERGADADVVVWDPETLRTVSSLTHHSACDSNVLEGVQLHGVPLAVISNGRLLLDEGVLNLIQGSGRYVDRPSFGDHVYGRVKIRDGLKPRRVDREPYTGEIADVVASLSGDLKNIAFGAHLSPNNPASFHARPLTKAGARNLQDSQFSIGGDWNQQEEGHATGRSRAKNPPGGKSSVVF
jgi:dihydropyrimidinase